MEFTFLPHSSTRQHRRYHYKPVDRKKGKSISLEPLEKTKNLALEPLGNLKNILLEPRPEKPTEPQEPSPELVAKIYYEPMLMKMILGHVHDFCDRCNIECASQRLYKLSKQTECIFPRNGHKLELIFKNWCNPSISVRVGTFEKECQCLSNAAFRNDFVLQKQPQELMDLLEKIFTRANPKKITHIRLGGKATEAARDHLLVLTHDLLLFVEDKFPNVKSLSLEGVVLHDSVVENLAKTPLKFFRKITELCLDRFSCESRDNLKSAMKQLIGKNLQYFTLNTFGMGHQGYAFLEHMNTLRHKVKTLDLHLDEDAFGANVSPESRAPEVIAQFLSDCMNFAENFRLHFWQDDRLSDSPQLFKLMTAISRMPSVVHISVLDLDIIARHPPQVVALSQILGTLKNLPCLRELASGGYRPRKATEGEVKLYIDSLTQALKCSPHLHKLRLANFPREFVTETMLSIIFTSIPQGVTSLSLESIRVRDQILLQTLARLNNLKHLDLTQMSRQTGSFLRHFLMRESLLRSFGCDIVCLAPAVTLMRNFSMHPFLSRIRIGFQSLNEDATIKLLSQYYEKVNIERWRIHPYKNFRTAYMLFCEHRRFDAPPTPLNDLRALTDDDVNAPRFRERRNNARFYHRSLCEVSYGPSDSIAREFDVDFAEG